MRVSALRGILIAAIGSLSVLVGCGGGGGSSSAPQAASPTAVPSTVIVSIVSTKAFTDTGAQVSTGEKLDIVSTGTITWSTSCLSNCNATPNGTPWNACLATPGGTFTAPGLPCWSLIGKIGTTGVPFEVGSALKFSAPYSGELYLGVNDNYYPDNAGSWKSTITFEN